MMHCFALSLTEVLVLIIELRSVGQKHKFVVGCCSLRIFTVNTIVGDLPDPCVCQMTPDLSRVSLRL